MPKIAILYEAGQAVLSTFELDEVLRRILDIARDHFDLGNVAILLLDENARQLSVRSQFGWDAGAETIPLGIDEGLTGAAVSSKRPIYAPDVKQDPRYVCSARSTRSELAIPLLVRGEAIGVMDCQSDELQHFDPQTIELLILFSTQASIAIENARLYNLERQRARQLEAINKVAQQSTAVLELDALLEQACGVIQEAFGVAHVSILLRDDEDLVLRAHRGTLKPRFDVSLRFPVSEAPWSLVIASGRLAEQRLDCRPASRQLFENCRSRLSIPLISFGQTLGVLTLHSSEPDAFRESDLRCLESLADICANSIQNARYVERVKQLAYLDGLTGIFNRRYFEQRFTEEVERALRYGTGMAVVMADIDEFKRLNDDFGHFVGDEVLRQVSSLFHDQLRKVDVVCRYGGEEFAILLTHANVQQASRIAEKLRRMVEKWTFPGVSRTVTMSAGVATFGLHGVSRDELIQAADRALYAAKQSGRNRVCLPGRAHAAAGGR